MNTIMGDRVMITELLIGPGANQHIQPREAALPADYQFWGEVMRLKGFFRAKRPDGSWDFNIS